MARLSENGIRLSALSPTYLDTNSTSHTWPFSAIAELIDNACDPGVCAKQMWIDVTEIKNELCLTFTDNGNGMTPINLHKMLSFGFTSKTGTRKHLPIGMYGNGFKSGSMRLGKDAIVFTKNGGALSVGLLSQSYLEQIKAQAVIVPIVPFNQQNKNMIVTEDSKPSLAAILQYSLFKTQEELLEEFDVIASKKGTRIIIWNIRRNKDGKPELDFETDLFDIRIPDISCEESSGNQGKKTSLRPERLDQHIPESDYSLRAYCSILYLKPRMQIVLRKKKVKTQLITKSLAHIENDVYKPSFSNKRVRITFGFNCKNKEHCGIMMYHRNRLMKSYEKVGCQTKSSSRASGVGVIGVIECNFLKPAHNKQNFDYTKEYRLTLQALGQKLNDYCKEKKAKEADSTGMVDEPRSSPDHTWVQCETCMKWRKLPPGVDPDSLPENWYCNMNPDSKFRDCSIPEEPEENDDEITPSYEKTFKKQDQSLEKRRKKSLEPEQFMSEVHSSGQRNSQWPSAKQRRRSSEPGQSEAEEDGRGPRSRSTSISTTSVYSHSVSEERVVSSSRGPRSNKRKPSSEDTNVYQKWPKQIAEEDPPEPPDTMVPKETEMVNSTGDSLADEEMIIIGGNDRPGVKGKVTQTSIKQEPETEAMETTEQGCNSETAKNSPYFKGLHRNIPGEELQVSQGTQFVRKTEGSDNLFGDPNCSQAGQAAHGETPVQNVPEIDLDSTKKYAAATVHFLDNQLDRLRNLLDETAKERECFRNQNEAMLITIQRMERQLFEYQQKPIQEEPNKKGLECSSTEGMKEGDSSLEEMSMRCQNVEQERDILTQQLQDAVNKLESCSLEKDQLKTQLGEIEQEREQLRLDYEKMKQDVKASTKRGEDFYWTKKAAAAYRYSELELMRTEIGKLKGEKLSLEEKLGEAQQWITIHKEARVPSTSQECTQANSALAKLKSLRINLGHLLACVLPHLDLRDINYETNAIDEILEKVIEENKL